MKKNISTIQRFLLPVALLIIASALILAERETAQQMRDIEEKARDQTVALTRLLNVTEALVGDQVASAMHLLQERGQALGAPTVTGLTYVDGKAVPNLILGNTPQANRFELVDSVTGLLGGTATLFVKSDDKFVRISTNVRQNQGARAVGTILDPNGKALSSIRQGKSFYGVVDILGEPYITGYEPMRNAKGEIIGVWYVGYKVDMKVLREAVENTHYLHSGFSAVLDYKNQVRFLSKHVSPAVAQDILNKRPQQWNIVRENIPGWGFKVMIAYPINEARAAGVSKSLIVIMLGSVFGIFLMVIIASQLRRLVLKPLGGDPEVAINLVRRISTGNLQDDDLQAEENTLMANMLKMRGNLREMVDTLRQNAERLSLSASVFQHANDGIFITDAKTHIIEVNPAFTRLTGYSREEALGKTPQQLKFASHDQDFFQRLWHNPESASEWRSETWNERKDGKLYAAWLDLFIVRNAEQQISHYVGVFSDMTLLKVQQQNLEQMAYHDSLTQLPNRTLLSDRLQQALAQAQRSGELLAVCYLDLDSFKPVNDTLGHDAGDQLLIELAQRIQNCVRKGDTVARLGGDEFSLLLCGMQTPQECDQTMERLLASIAMPYRIAGETVSVSASIGYTLFPLDNANPDTLLRHADQAMYHAKLHGGNRSHLFDAEHDRHTRARRQIRDLIEAALPKEEFLLHYQPKVDMRHGKVIGLEALIRWQDPQHGLRYPGDFLPAIEDTDFSIPLGEWVIQKALQQMHIWQQAGLELPVSVNISARHLMQPDFATRLSILLERNPEIPPQWLELEITESAAIEDIASVSEVIEACNRLGVTFALDDFGVGYSSLTYLRRLPVTVLKIDQSFVRDMLNDPEDMALVAAVIGLSRELRRRVVAEGVETAEHGVQLLRMHCDLAQGYGIARPMPPEAVPGWVVAYEPAPAWAEHFASIV